MRFDHHCVWLGTCIGKRNYKYFFIFIAFLNLFAAYAAAFCIIAIKVQVDIEEKEVGEALKK